MNEFDTERFATPARFGASDAREMYRASPDGVVKLESIRQAVPGSARRVTGSGPIATESGVPFQTKCSIGPMAGRRPESTEEFSVSIAFIRTAEMYVPHPSALPRPKSPADQTT